MFCDGRDTFFGVDCIFVENQVGMNIYPIDENDIGKIYRHTMSVDFSINYRSGVDKNTTINVHRMNSSFGREFELKANYVIKRIEDTPISMMEITSEAIDSLFSTVKYYYQQRVSGKETNADLLYGRDVVDTWKINHHGKEINVSLFYGEVLHRGIASDTKIHPKLSVAFPKTTNAEELYEIYSIIRFFLQISRYGFNIGKTRVDLYDERKSHQGFLFDYSIQELECTYSEMKHGHIKEYTGSLLQFAADHHGMQINFFPKDYHGLFNDSYNGLLFASIYAGFERECHAKKELYEDADDSLFRDKKDEIIEFIQKKKAENDGNNEWFYNGIEERVSQFGTQIGQEKRIVNAYEVLSKALNSSMQHIFFMPSFRITSSPHPEDVKRIAKTISGFRGKVLHDGEKSTFSDDEAPYVHFLEILVYSMILKRAGIPDERIELIIGVIFHCNYVAMETEFGHKSKE